VAKPATMDGYTDAYTLDCERVLVTLLRGLGPWKDSIFLIGGLTPRYLVRARPPAVPPHAGSQDVDIVIDLQILADTQAYQTLEQNLQRMGFERARNELGRPLSWRWQTRTEKGARMILELLAESPDVPPGRVRTIPSERGISALNIPYASIVFDLHQVIEVSAELLGSNGVATETVRHANLVSFTCLKAFAFDQRNERKDAHDLIYCLEHAPEGFDGAGEMFRSECDGKHATVVRRALEILFKRFADGPAVIEGYLKDGPVAVAKFELGESDDPETRERRALRQRQVSDLIDRLSRHVR
jgi:hypothetical protein